MTDTAPDFALPLRVDANFTRYILDANGRTFAYVPDKEWADKLVTAVNNAAARDAEIARLRDALENTEYALTRLRALVRDIDGLQGREHTELGIAVNYAIDLARAALSSTAEAGSAPPDPRDAEIARLREALRKIAGGFQGEGLAVENEWRKETARAALSSIPTPSDTETKG